MLLKYLLGVHAVLERVRMISHSVVKIPDTLHWMSCIIRRFNSFLQVERPRNTAPFLSNVHSPVGTVLGRALGMLSIWLPEFLAFVSLHRESSRERGAVRTFGHRLLPGNRGLDSFKEYVDVGTYYYS
jgi:hypothetical protein